MTEYMVTSYIEQGVLRWTVAIYKDGELFTSYPLPNANAAWNHAAQLAEKNAIKTGGNKIYTIASPEATEAVRRFEDLESNFSGGNRACWKVE